MRKEIDKDLRELVERLSATAGSNLATVVIYGDAVANGSSERRSDVNVLCLLKKTSGAELARLHTAARWWCRKEYPVPLVFTLEELRESADIFAIELLDMKRRYVLLFGDDFLPSLNVPMSLHCHQVERELRSNVIRLRESYLRSLAHSDEISAMMTNSAAWFAVLFRHSLIALGEPEPDGPRTATEQLAAKLNLDLKAFHTALDLREGKRNVADLHAAEAFGCYLDAVASVADEMDRQLAAR